MTLKDAQNKFIIKTATGMFLNSSIDKVTMSAIAREVGVGDATLYRKFSTKQALVMACAVDLEGDVFARFQKPTEGKSGYEMIRQFYETYLEIFRENPSFYAFLFQLDAMLPDMSGDEKGQYEDSLGAFRYLFHDGYAKGLADGSVRAVNGGSEQAVDEDTFYFATTHALLNLCMKLTCQGNLLTQDEALNKAGEVQCIIDIIMYRLQA